MKRKNKGHKSTPQMSATVQYMMRMLSNMSIIFLVMCAIGLFFLKADGVERGIYYFVAIVNLIVVVGSNLMLSFMVKSDKAYKKAIEKKEGREGKKTISDWLKNH